MEQNITNPSVRSLLWLFLQTFCPLSVSINYTVQLNLALVVHRDSFHRKMQFSPRLSALPNGLHRVSLMVSGWFLGGQIDHHGNNQRLSPYRGQLKSTAPWRKHIWLSQKSCLLSAGCCCRLSCSYTWTQGLCQNVEWGIWLENEWGKHANF